MTLAASQRGGISASHLAKSFGRVRVINDISLTVAPGEFVALLGPSGGGKTSLLRAVAGLITPDAGTIAFGNDMIVDAASGHFVAAEKRNIGMVFQDYALWPHLRVRENVAFPLEARRVPKDHRAAMVDAALKRVGLAHLAERFPSQLSGGEQQRVALARATVDQPSILLFDEPLSNLDAGLRESLGREIASLVRSLGATALYVTHDQSEALSLADRIAVMRDGQIVQSGAPQEIYRAPNDLWIAQFMKAGNLVQGNAANGAFVPAGAKEALALPDLVNGFAGPSTLMLPFGALKVGGGDLRLAVTAAQFRGDRFEIIARWGSANAGPTLQFWHDRAIAPGETLSITIDRAGLKLFKEEPTR